MNFVHVVGRLAKDPETRFTASGQKVTTLVVASNTYRAGTEETVWWRVTLWGDRWDKMITHLSKGKPIMVGGEMKKPEMYTDKSGVQQIGSIEITADYLKFVPFGKNDQSEEGQQAGNSGFKRQGQSFDHAFGGSSGGGSYQEESEVEEEPLPF